MSNLRPLRSVLPAAHQARFSAFAADLQKSIKQSVPTDFGRYERASILSFDWSNDTMGVKSLRDDLLRLLQNVYGFKTESYILQANDPPQAILRDLRDIIIDFGRKNSPKSTEKTHLLIYYYSGHSDPGPQQNELRLAGRVNSTGDLIPPYINWYRLSATALDVPGCESLLIMDSCNSAMATIRPDGEILTAAGWESTTPASLAFSFTQILIDEIKAMAGRAFTASDLHAKLLTNAQQNNIGATPIHRASLHHPSVLIHKIGSREARDLVRASQNTTARVLITVSIAANVLPDVNEWDQWLTSNMPSGIRDVEVVAHWDSFSRGVLVCLPVQMWDYLRDDAAYSFVSYVWGEVSIGLPRSAPPAPQGKENVPFQGSSGPNIGPPSSGGPLLPLRPQPDA